MANTSILAAFERMWQHVMNVVSKFQTTLDKKIESPDTATVGQILAVKTVDDNNKPTEWETADVQSMGVVYNESDKSLEFINAAVSTGDSSSASGSGVSVQADHAQNDSTQPDYIKNRTHYKDYGTILNQDVTTALDEDGLIAYEYENDSITIGDEGDTYVVTFDGAVHEYQFSQGQEEPCLGNLIIYLEAMATMFNMTVEELIEIIPDFAFLNNDTGESFFIVVGDGVIRIMTREAGTYNVVIEGTIHNKIDKRFMPPINELPYVDTYENGKTLSVVEGEWAVTEAVSGLPEVTASNNGQVMGVVDGAWAVTEAVSGLPEVTTDDNNKVLMVVDGVWAAGSIDDGDEVAY